MSGDWVEAFLYLLERTGNFRLSAERCGVSRQAVYQRAQRDQRLAEKVRQARGRRRGRVLDRVR